MNETFNSWADPPLHLRTQNMMDPLVQGLATPPNTTGLQSPFVYSYGYTAHHFDIPPGNLSFVSSATIDSEGTLVGNEATANIDSFLSNTNVNLGDFDHNSNGWHMPHTESFDLDPAWVNYNVPASTPHLGWDTDAKNQAWPKSSPAKQIPWIADPNGKHDEQWNDAITGATKQDQNYVEAMIKQKLLPWIDHDTDRNGGTVKDASFESNGVRLPNIGGTQVKNGTSVTKEQDEHAWNGHDGGFDYNQLAEPLE
jgi:transcriptional enhancer factor